jgi:hypothetical protein
VFVDWPERPNTRQPPCFGRYVGSLGELRVDRDDEVTFDLQSIHSSERDCVRASTLCLVEEIADAAPDRFPIEVTCADNVEPGSLQRFANQTRRHWLVF